EVDGVPPRFNNETNETIPWEQEHYNLMRNATGTFRINLADEYREIRIRVSSTRNAEIYDTFAIIIDPNMTPTLSVEPPPTAETPTPTPAPAPITETEISQFLPAELEVFEILGHLRNLEMTVWDVQSILFNPIVADEDYWRALEGMNRIDNNFWNNFNVLDRILRDFPVMEEEWRWLQDLGTIYINLFAAAFETLHGLPPEYHAAALQTPASAAVQIRSIISELQALLMQNPNIGNADLLAEYSLLRDIESRLRQADSIPIFTPNGVLSRRFINAYESGIFADLEGEIAEILENISVNVEFIRQTTDRYFFLTNRIFHAAESELWGRHGVPILREDALHEFERWLTISENEIRQAILEEQS
ncbi:MAG: hypothetical protein FWG65_01830, partial [Turicibacter sp.]|nr:hypothetical protein [Turicibacter sp.]